MPDSFSQFQAEYEDWKNSGFQSSNTRTTEFLEHLLQRKEGMRLWPHQKESILRAIFSYEVEREKLGNKVLLKIVTGGGKSLIIACLIAWMKYCYSSEVDRYLIVATQDCLRRVSDHDFICKAGFLAHSKVVTFLMIDSSFHTRFNVYFMPLFLHHSLAA